MRVSESVWVEWDVVASEHTHVCKDDGELWIRRGVLHVYCVEVELMGEYIHESECIQCYNIFA